MQRIEVTNPDNLIAGGPINTATVIIQQGLKLFRGDVLGKVRYSCPTSGTAGSNTGNGTLGSVRPGRLLKIGTYTITAVATIANSHTLFRVTDPDSQNIGSFICGVGTGDLGHFSSDQISLIITNGATDFAANDSFTIAVSGVVTAQTAISGGGNGTLVQVQPRKDIQVGVYTIKCVEAIANGGKFNLLDAAGNVLGTAFASKFVPTGTANGTLTEITAGPLFKRNGAYTIECTTTASHGGTFVVRDPDGFVVTTFSMSAGAGAATVVNTQHISFKITDGSNDFAVGDRFTVYLFESDLMSFVIWDGSQDFVVDSLFTVTASRAMEQCRLVNSTNVDGSNIPEFVLAENVDASLSQKVATVYNAGVFRARSLRFGGNDTYETHRDALRSKGILIEAQVLGTVL